ncbi:MAG: alpha/beta hydrolase [Acidobacteria bacterium]|nr:alpha/beta hydrolase [Acidobacteriota bacterium]
MNNKAFTTSDQVRLNYLEEGSGNPLVMIPGWSQTAEQWKPQIEELSTTYRCLALDMRGHGDSDKPDYGYSVYRLAKDVHEFLTQNNLSNVTLMGHSMGCSIIWAYWELFGADRLSRLVLVDEAPFITLNSSWSSEELAAAGGILPSEAVTELCNAISGPDGEAARANLISGMLTAQCPDDLKQWILACNTRLPRRQAAALLYNHCHQDWRNIIPRIDIPTLVIGGRVSLVPWTAVEWIAQQIPGARLEIFEADEGGQHFLLMENPQKFNRLVAEFIS